MTEPATIGELRRVISLQSPADSIDSFGQPVRTWTTYATVRAKIETLSGSEPSIAEQQQIEQTHTITIRYWPNVTSNHRALYGSRIFYFNFVQNVDEQGRWLIIDSVERTGAN
jgi:SPP1 family predicted phage head-tail adaptor